jgi:TPR repeat protein
MVVVTAWGCSSKSEPAGAPADAAVIASKADIEGAPTDCPHDKFCENVPTAIELPTELAELRPQADQCLGGDANTCVRLGKALLFKSKTDESRKAADAASRIAYCTYRRSCDRGEHNGCLRLMALIPRLRHDPTNTYWRCLAHYGKKGCLAGHAVDCGHLASALRFLESPRADKVRAYTIGQLTGACEGGDSEACVKLASEYELARGRGSTASYRYYERAATLDAKACEAGGDADACSRAGERYASRPLVDWKLAGKYYTLACRKHPENPLHPACEAAMQFGDEIAPPPARRGKKKPRMEPGKGH